MPEQEKHTADLFGENKSETEFDPVKLLFGESSNSRQSAAPLFGESVSPQPGTVPLFGESSSSQPETASLFGEPLSSPAKPEKTVIEEPVLLSRDAVCSVPAEKTAVPVVEEPVPAEKTAVPVVEEPVPAEKTAVPVVEEPVPAEKTAAPVVEEPVPAVEEKAEPVTKPGKTDSEMPESPMIIGDKESQPVETFKTYTPLVHRTVVPSVSVEKSSIGEFMSDVRRQSGCTLEEVAASTRIRKFYIEAIEKDEFDKLPMGSFPAAYIRTLCAFYGLEGSAVDQLVEKTGNIKHKEKMIPKEIIEQIGSTATYNQNEEKKLMRIVVACGAVLALIVVGIIGLVIWFLIPGDKSSSAPEKNTVENVQTVQPDKADEALFDQLTAPETPGFRTLSVPSGK